MYLTGKEKAGTVIQSGVNLSAESTCNISFAGNALKGPAGTMWTSRCGFGDFERVFRPQ